MQLEKMPLHALPEEGIHLSSCFVHALFLVLSVYHAAFAMKNSVPGHISILKYDPAKHTLLAVKAGLAIVLTGITFGEFVYQLDHAIYPDTSITLFYTEQCLTFLAWMSNTVTTLVIARNGAWVYFKVMDHVLIILAWIFVFAVEALRFDQFVVEKVKSSSEQLTSTVILAVSLIYFFTLVGFHVVDFLRHHGTCLNKYDHLDEENQEGDSRGASTSTTSSTRTTSTEVEVNVIVHRDADDA